MKHIFIGSMWKSRSRVLQYDVPDTFIVLRKLESEEIIRGPDTWEVWNITFNKREYMTKIDFQWYERISKG